MVLDGQRELSAHNLRRQFHMAADPFRIGVVDDIRHTLLGGEIQRLHCLLIHIVLAAYREDETSHTAYLRHLVLHDDAARRM